MQNDWDVTVNMYMSGEISDAQAIQMLGREYDSFEANEDRALESFEKFLFEGDDKVLSEAQGLSMKLLINSIRIGSVYHDNVIGLMDVVSLAANDEDFIKNNTIAGFEYGTSILLMDDDGIHIGGWRNQRSQRNPHIKGLPQTNLIFQDSVFHYNANLTIPFLPVKVGMSLDSSRYSMNRTQIIIESDSDVIVTPAGKFENCLRLKTPEHKPHEIFTLFALMPDTPITKIGWYALGVGMVKFQIIQGEEVKEFQLLYYELPPTKTDSYFPINIGVKWVYEWQSKWFLCREISRPVNIVERMPGGREYHMHFGTLYALRP